MPKEGIGRLTLTMRVGETVVINVDGEQIEVKYVRTGGRNKGTVQIVADRRHSILRGGAVTREPASEPMYVHGSAVEGK